MKKSPVLIGISFLAGALFFALTFGYLQKSPATAPSIGQPIVYAETIKKNPLDFTQVVKKVRPAVVMVISEAVVERSKSLFGDDLIDRFFNIPRSGRERVSGMGSGFIISKDGYIITNNHVVQKAQKVIIDTLDQKKYTARIIGLDQKTDLALLKIKGKNLPFIELGDSNKVEVGEWVLAIGNPFYQQLSVTAGIISAKGRQLGAARYEDFLQTDAAINRGNSGGPLVNMNGKVIGINSAIVSPYGGSVGIGFAIPSSMAKKVIEDLKTEGRVVRGFLGINVREATETYAKDLDLPHAGVWISKVEKGSPAAAAGLKRYDMIEAMDGKTIKSMRSFDFKIAETKPGMVVELSINRNNKRLKVKVTIGEAPDSIKYRSQGPESRTVDLGMVLVNNTRNLAREYNLGTSQGVLVRTITRNGPASNSGVRRGDVILSVNRTRVRNVDHFRDIISSKRAGSKVLLLINRQGEEGDIILQLPE